MMTTEEWNDMTAGEPRTMTHPLAALIADVPRYEPRSDATMRLRQHGRWLFLDEVLAALEAAHVPDLVEAGKVLEGVTPGPWEERFGDGGWEVDGGERFCTPVHRGGKFENARFIAWCREGVPALIALATAQAAQIAGLRQAMTDADNDVILAHEARKEAQTEAATLRAEVERLRGALETEQKKVLRLEARLWSIGHAAGIETKKDLMEIARAALEGKA